MKLKKLIAAALVATMPLTLAACADDEDGDGVSTDEEVGQLDDTADSIADEVDETADSIGDEIDEEMDDDDNG